MTSKRHVEQQIKDVEKVLSKTVDKYFPCVFSYYSITSYNVKMK